MALLQSRWLRLGRSSTRVHSYDCQLRYFSASVSRFVSASASGSTPSGNSPSGSKRFRQHVNPLSMVYRQPLKLPEWAQCFSDTSLPIHLDIGCARGKYLMDVAESQASKRNFVGVEIRRNVLQEAEREAERRGLTNLAFVHANMNIHQTKLLQSLPGPVTSVSIFHPDPWMKKRHIKRRLVTEEFVEEMSNDMTMSPLPTAWTTPSSARCTSTGVIFL
ncbi:tRNA (guanine-N(7)-)-methyltransferase [Phytophthora palmivora]|uniref:tRNA (guanine(46)-N(7))-methyltransferase n=1 Tax=Phytophthora palmivora TaxID=4796 RepID=A0A2P4XY50_9STRA|nr:tRNA (guanine-N(7)-)-methyltransferase [Phytophthora palmivora]